MKLQLTTIILICFEQFTKVIAQGMPISPCPKIFQYRFDGNEWFGLIAVRHPDVQALQIRVTLSMRGKPTTVRRGAPQPHSRLNIYTYISMPSNFPELSRRNRATDARTVHKPCSGTVQNTLSQAQFPAQADADFGQQSGYLLRIGRYISYI